MAISEDLTAGFPPITGELRAQIVRKIAEGGMGAVYEGRLAGADGFEKTVAIKVMLRRLTDPKYAAMFVAEAKLVANLVHENIVQIYHLGSAAGAHFIIMEYVRGLSLASFIASHKDRGLRLPANLAVHIASRVVRGLAYAHKRRDEAGTPLGIVHRDVCPSNILLTTEGLPKLGDFGVAKAATTAALDDSGQGHRQAVLYVSRSGAAQAS